DRGSALRVHSRGVELVDSDGRSFHQRFNDEALYPRAPATGAQAPAGLQPVPGWLVGLWAEATVPRPGMQILDIQGDWDYSSWHWLDSSIEFSGQFRISGHTLFVLPQFCSRWRILPAAEGRFTLDTACHTIIDAEGKTLVRVYDKERRERR